MENKSHNSNLLTNPHNEGVVLLKLSKLKPFEEQPFKVLLDDSMTELVQSIKERGVLTPIVVRTHKEEGYEILSGHRRVKACELQEDIKSLHLFVTLMTIRLQFFS